MLLPYPGHTDPFLAPLLLNKGLCISRRTLVTYSALRMAERAQCVGTYLFQLCGVPCSCWIKVVAAKRTGVLYNGSAPMMMLH